MKTEIEDFLEWNMDIHEKEYNRLCDHQDILDDIVIEFFEELTDAFEEYWNKAISEALSYSLPAPIMNPLKNHLENVLRMS